MSIPKTRILAPVKKLQLYFGELIPVIALLVILFAMLTSQKVLKRILTLNRASKVLAAGDYSLKVAPYGEDEISELAVSFNTMASDLQARESTLLNERRTSEAFLRKHNLELEDKVRQRTRTIMAAQNHLSDFKDAIDEHSIVTITDIGGTIIKQVTKF